MSQLTTAEAGVILRPQDNTVQPLYDIVDQFNRKVIQKPVHQRDFVWSGEQQVNWIRRLNNPVRPVGVIVTYQLDNGQPSPVFLNDGLQRISSTQALLADPSRFGFTSETAELVTRACNMTVQHRHYASHDDAAQDFQNLNLGTNLTEYEFHKCTLTYLPHWEIWEPLFDKLHQIAALNSARICETSRQLTRDQKHTHLRWDYAVWHRLMSQSTDLTDYSVTSGRERRYQLRGQNTMEWMLRSLLETLGHQIASDSLVTLQRIFEQETALIEDIWHARLRAERGQGISPTAYRFLIDCSVWRRNQKVPYTVWESFVYRLLRQGNGKSKLIGERPDDRDHFADITLGEERPTAQTNYVDITLNLGRMTNLKTVCSIIGSDLWMHTRPARRKTLNNLKAGYDESHLLPFAANGNGPTISEPAGRNRARGAQPVVVRGDVGD